MHLRAKVTFFFCLVDDFLQKIYQCTENIYNVVKTSLSG